MDLQVLKNLFCENVFSPHFTGEGPMCVYNTK